VTIKKQHNSDENVASTLEQLLLFSYSLPHNLHNSPIRQTVLLFSFYSLENNDLKRLIKVSKIMSVLSSRGRMEPPPPDFIPCGLTSSGFLLVISRMELFT
jgi:hypothetical protein